MYSASTGQPEPMRARGNMILRVSESIYPFLMEKLSGCRDENDMPVQPAHVRAVALNMAQEWVKYNQSYNQSRPQW